MRILIFLNILILIGFGGATYWLRQKTHALIDSKKQGIVRDALLKDAKAKLTTVREDVRNADEKYEAVRKKLPTEQQVPDFFSYVSDLAAKDGVKAEFGNTLQANVSPSNTGEVPLLLTISGTQSTDAIRHFISDLEHSNYIIALNDVSITGGAAVANGSGSSQASAASSTVGFTLYVKKATN